MAAPVRSESIEALFGSHCVAAAAGLVSPEAIAMLAPVEADAITPMASARQAEFATGRWCARQALNQIGAADSAIPRHHNRAPAWPDGITGSITHTAGWCAAIAARAAGGIVSVGIDAEQIDRLRPAVERRILNAVESDELAQRPTADRQLYAAVTFAAKEAFYKAHHQIEARYLGFDAVSVIHRPDKGVSFAPCSGSVAADVAGRSYGSYLTRDGLVIVGVWIEGAD